MIFGISSYSEHGLRKNLLFFILEFYEFEYHVKYSSSTWIFSRNSSSMNLSTSHGTRVPNFFFFFLIFQFAITRLSKNRVLNWNSIFRKSSFKIGDILLKSFGKRGKCPFSSVLCLEVSKKAKLLKRRINNWINWKNLP